MYDFTCEMARLAFMNPENIGRIVAAGIA